VVRVYTSVTSNSVQLERFTVGKEIGGDKRVNDERKGKRRKGRDNKYQLSLIDPRDKIVL